MNSYKNVVGNKDIEQDSFSVRSRQHGRLGFMTTDSLFHHVQSQLEQGKPKYIRSMELKNNNS